MKRGSTTFSIFGQIEEVVALAMIEEHRLHKIEANMIPATAAWSDSGDPARFAVVMPNNLIAEFDRRIAQLRA